ncbi:uncharacterized protein [Ptychodera flava]|uniref:uncharacterized protein n=1 Tax=Ptychodera flava TaxID=63121 RepID=UPI003969FBBB
MQQRYTEVCLLFGEKSKSIEPTDFFKYMTDFIEDFKKAMGDIKTNDFGLYDEVRKPTQRSVVSVTREATPTGTTIFEKRRSSKPLTTAIIKPTPVSRRAPSRPSTNDDKSELVGNKDNSQRVFYEQRKMVNSSTLGMFAGEGQDSPNSQGRRPFLDANAEPYAQVEDDADSGIQEYPTSSVKKPLKSALKNTNAELQNGVSKTGSDLLDSKEKRDSDSVIRHNEVVYDTHIPSTRPAVTNKRRAPQPPILPGAENLLRQGNSGLGQNSIYTEADIKITPL